MKKTFSNDKTYVSHDLLSFGDYDNSRAVERANVRVLKEKHPGFAEHSFSDWDQGKQLVNTGHSHEWEDILPGSEIVELHGGYGSVQVWIREDIDEENGYTAALENYPCLDDEAVSEIEQEIEEEYLKGCFSDIMRYFSPGVMDAIELLDCELFDDEAYHEAMEAANLNFIVESGGIGHIDLKKLAPFYEAELIHRNRGIEAVKNMIAALDTLPVFPLGYYDSAQDMLDHRDATGQGITPEEARAILRYAAELEAVIEEAKS